MLKVTYEDLDFLRKVKKPEEHTKQKKNRKLLRESCCIKHI